MSVMDERMQKVLENIKASPREVRVFPVDEKVLAECKERLPLNWGSLLGVLLENTGGIVIDGWLRFYGAGELNIIERNKLMPFRELAIAEDILGGVFLLLACQDVVGFDKLWKLLVPAIIVIIGLKMVFRGIFGRRTSRTFVFQNPGNRNTFAAFSGQTVVLEKETFEGAEVSAVFGGVEYDLRKALITQDCGLKVSAIFGGIDIFVPDNVNVVVNCTSILGGVDNQVPPRPGCPTLYISGTCMFGGVDVK